MAGGSILTVNLLKLGKLKYIPALNVQKYIQQIHLKENSHANNHNNQTLILVEHDPVYTLGFREKVDPEETLRLTNAGAEVVHADRGGLTTFHGPGQLVAYPVFHLGKFHRMSVRSFVAALENVAVHSCRLMGVPAELSLDNVSHTGAWANNNKICAIGVHCKRHVTTHGLALNCNVDLNWYKNIVPCGIKDKGVTSLSAELGENISVDEATSQFLASFESIFKCKFKEISSDQVLDIVKKSQSQ